MPQRRRNLTAPQARLPFEWPAPDITDIGDFVRGKISCDDRDEINGTLPREIDRDKLWTELDPAIRETRSARQIVEALQSEIRELEFARRKLSPFVDTAALQPTQAHIAKLQEASRYYENLARQSDKIQRRFKRFRILRAYLTAGGMPTVSTPDNPDGVTQADKRGRGKPVGPLVEYLRTTLRIICNDDLKPEAVKSWLYRDYKEFFHYQVIGSLFRATGSLDVGSGKN
jgi:hypothetical protein